MNELQEIAKQLALKAITFDRSGQHESATFYYLEASQALIDFKQYLIRNSKQDEVQLGQLNTKLSEYLSRAEYLKTTNEKTNLNKESSSSNVKTEFEV
jgi:hypothetical protein